jgi:hypothetical protein
MTQTILVGVIWIGLAVATIGLLNLAKRWYRR